MKRGQPFDQLGSSNPRDFFELTEISCLVPDNEPFIANILEHIEDLLQEKGINVLLQDTVRNKKAKWAAISYVGTWSPGGPMAVSLSVSAAGVPIR